MYIAELINLRLILQLNQCVHLHCDLTKQVSKLKLTFKKGIVILPNIRFYCEIGMFYATLSMFCSIALPSNIMFKISNFKLLELRIASEGNGR